MVRKVAPPGVFVLAYVVIGSHGRKGSKAGGDRNFGSTTKRTSCLDSHVAAARKGKPEFGERRLMNGTIMSFSSRPARPARHALVLSSTFSSNGSRPSQAKPLEAGKAREVERCGPLAAGLASFAAGACPVPDLQPLCQLCQCVQPSCSRNSSANTPRRHLH